MADEHLTDEPSGGRDASVKSIAQKVGLSKGSGKHGFFGLAHVLRVRTSPIARRIIIVNLLALSVLLIGMMYLSQFRTGLVSQKQESLAVESQLYVDLAATLKAETPTGTIDFSKLAVADGVTVRLYSPEVAVDGEISGPAGFDGGLTNGVSKYFSKFMDMFTGFRQSSRASGVETEKLFADKTAELVLAGEQIIRRTVTAQGNTIVAAGRPVVVDGAVVGALVMSTQPGYLDALLRAEQTTIMRLFFLAIVVSIVLSIVLAGSIANPINDLARAMEAGTSKQGRTEEPDRVRIPDLSGRPDEIGHLSRAMRDMTSALYERIDTNEEFAADVAHEIKNPLASLRSAVETLRIAPEGDGRRKLLDVIEHDVRRLDRLVSDISNASRLDAELVKEEMESFDLSLMLERIADFHGHEANDKGVELLWDAPSKPIMFDGLEARLAQVFVNLISNAVSFCDSGDVVRVWARERDDRVLIVVEDTGPGIPNEALEKVFKRFYSERPEHDYGNNSGLGLSISKQIVEAHRGVIWAENIQALEASEDAAPNGARFIVGLPV